MDYIYHLCVKGYENEFYLTVLTWNVFSLALSRVKRLQRKSVLHEGFGQIPSSTEPRYHETPVRPFAQVHQTVL